MHVNQKYKYSYYMHLGLIVPWMLTVLGDETSCVISRWPLIFVSITELPSISNFKGSPAIVGTTIELSRNMKLFVIS